MTSARLLSGGVALPSSPEGGGVMVRLPATAPDPIVSVVELQLAGVPDVGE